MSEGARPRQKHPLCLARIAGTAPGRPCPYCVVGPINGHARAWWTSPRHETMLAELRAAYRENTSATIRRCIEIVHAAYVAARDKTKGE